MGLLSSVGKFFATTKVGQAIAKPLDVLSGIVTNPVTALTKGTSAATATFKAASVTENVSKTILNVGTAALIVTGVGAAATAAKAGTLTPAIATAAKSLIPATVKGKVVAAIAAPIVVGAVSKKPVETAKALIKAPSELGKFGADVATFAATPSIETGKQLITESPIIAAGIGLALGGATALKVAPAIASARQVSAIQEQTEALREFSIQPKTTQPLKAIRIEEITDEKPATSAPTPVTPATQQITKTATTRRKRAKKKPIITAMSQKVNVLVSNIGNKRYLNKVIYAR